MNVYSYYKHIIPNVKRKKKASAKNADAMLYDFVTLQFTVIIFVSLTPSKISILMISSPA